MTVDIVLTECIQCQTVHPSDSHFCSPACREAWGDRMSFVCDCQQCNFEAPQSCVVAALQTGWRDITPDPEGWSWNYVGVCPECVKGVLECERVKN